MNYGKRRRLTASDDERDSFSCSGDRHSVHSTNTNGAETRDSVPLSRTLRDCFNWFVDSFRSMKKYKFFNSKNQQEQNTDVFLKSSRAVNNSPRLSMLNNESRNHHQSNNFNSSSLLNTNRRMSLHRSNFFNTSKFGQLPSKSGMNTKEFYGNSNENNECVVLKTDRDEKISLVKEKRPQILLNTRAPEISPDILEINVSIKDKVDEKKKSDFEILVKKVYFNNYSCLVKGLEINQDCFKLLNVPPCNSSRQTQQFKFHISIPISEISEVSSCVSDVQVFLLLRTIPESNKKVCNALNLNQQDESGLIIIELDPQYWNVINAHLNNLSGGLTYKRTTYVEVNNLIKKLSGTFKDSNIVDSVIIDRVYTPEKRKVAKPAAKCNSKQMKPSVIEIDDSGDVDEKPTSSSNTVLNYPPGEKDSITISLYDMNCLEEEQFLNDSILGFYLKYIHKEVADKSIASKSYIFNTFFYGKLSKCRKNEDMSKPLCERVYERVKNWTKSVDIFEKDFLIIPMNKNYHWFLAIVCYPKMVSSVKPSWREQCKKENNPCIIYMDSLGTANGTRLSEPIRHFLSMEWKIKKGTQMLFTKQILPDYYPRVPYQTNSSDCGLFVLQYVEQFLTNPDFVLNNLASVGLEEWFPPSVIQKKRKDLQSLIQTLSSEANMDCESEEKSQVEDLTEAMNEDVESPIVHNIPLASCSVVEDTSEIKQTNDTEPS